MEYKIALVFGLLMTLGTAHPMISTPLLTSFEFHVNKEAVVSS